MVRACISINYYKSKYHKYILYRCTSLKFCIFLSTEPINLKSLRTASTPCKPNKQASKQVTCTWYRTLNISLKLRQVLNQSAPAIFIKLKDWSWNKRWTRIDADKVESGTKAEMRASYEGNGKWQACDCEIDEVGSIRPIRCLFYGYHTMKLDIEGDGEPRSRLLHTEKFVGLLPTLKLGLPFHTLIRNYGLVEHGLKC